MSRTSAALVLALATMAGARASHAQSWRLRLDAAAQRVEFRGVSMDSIPLASVQTSGTGGLESPDGFAVDCIGDGFCRFFRPGAKRAGIPASAGMDLTMWGFGVRGLSLRVNASALTDLSGDRLWPGTSPAFRLMEGYVEYIRNSLTLQGGRMLERGRLASAGSSGLDGLKAVWRSETSGIEVGGYAGWGMARGTVLLVTSPAVDPLADYQPSARQIVVGALAGAHRRTYDVQAEYRRELDPVTDYIVAERVALSAQAQADEHVRFTTGADYDMAQGRWGSAEAAATYTGLRITGTLAARHYRPFFDLWTVWGVFSPVAFNGVSGAVAVNPTKKLQLRSRAEWFKYDDADVTTPTVGLEDRGWRWALEATYVPSERWTMELDTHGEKLPGASSSGIDGRVAWHPRPAIDLTMSGGSLARPLELRFQDAGVTYAGVAMAYRTKERWRFDVGLDRYWETRDRPDAGSFDWNQWRLSARASLTLRSSADQWLPPAHAQGSTP